MQRKVELGDRNLTIIGTAHVSEESRNEVAEAIGEKDPDRIFVELDEKRLESLQEDSGWKDLDIVESIRDGNGFLLFMNLLLSIYQRKMGLDQDVKPGAELLEAVDLADEKKIEYTLIDQDINDTFRKTLDNLSFWEKFKLVGSLFIAGDEMDVDDLKEGGMLDSVVTELEEEFPTIKKVFLDDRNTYMAERILEEDFEEGVAVVGAAHVEGLVEELEKTTEERRKAVKDEPEGFSVPWMKVLKYGLPGFILVSLSYVFVFCSPAKGLILARNAFLINAILPFIGAIIARSSPVTWVISFVAAPFTSMDPALGAGMVAAYAEGKINPPTVQEMEDVVKLTEYRELWSNQAGRILLTFVFVTLGSALATFIAAFYLGVNIAC
jgi:pheromone shutdown-related protein TraB